MSPATLSDLLLLTLFIILLTIPAVRAAYAAGRAAGWKAGYGARTDERNEKHEPEPVLEIINTSASGNIQWRYGTGETLLNGFCVPEAFPGRLLEEIEKILDAQRHQHAADELIDEYLTTHGPYRGQE